MLKRARVAALLILGPVPCLAALSCMADVKDDRSPDEAAGVAAEPLVDGPCLTACQAVQTGDCDWSSQCSDDSFPAVAYCGQRFLTCDEAEHAASGDLYGVTYCWRGCQNLH